MRRSDLPDYLEAFPRLAMAEANRARRRKRWITWYNQVREEVGWGELWWEDWKVTLQYNLPRLDFVEPQAGRRFLDVTPIAKGSHNHSFNVLCRVCARYVPSLFFRTGDWLCQQCQGLRYRSTFISPQSRWLEEYDRLRFLIGEGRVPGMRERDYLKQRERMYELRGKLDGLGRRPGPEFFRLVFAEWHDQEPVD